MARDTQDTVTVPEVVLTLALEQSCFDRATGGFPELKWDRVRSECRPFEGLAGKCFKLNSPSLG